MSLAQVVYNISNDTEFATQWRRDPQTALKNRGLQLSREELAFLSVGLQRGGFEDSERIRLKDVAKIGRDWN
jgi:hypothetical protein